MDVMNHPVVARVSAVFHTAMDSTREVLQHAAETYPEQAAALQHALDGLSESAEHSKVFLAELMAAAHAGDPLALSAAVSLVALLLVILIVYMMRPSRVTGDTFLILGPSGSGKTSLFYRLRQERHMPVVPSLAPNIDSFAPVGFPGPWPLSYSFVDAPADCFWNSSIASHYQSSRLIMFVIDLSDDKSFRDASDMLYELLRNPVVYSRAIPLALVFNKAKDASTAPSHAVARIEAQIEHLRAVADSMQDISGTTTAAPTLGKPGRPFTLAHVPNPVQVLAVDCASPDSLAPLTEVLSQHI